MLASTFEMSFSDSHVLLSQQILSNVCAPQEDEAGCGSSNAQHSDAPTAVAASQEPKPASPTPAGAAWTSWATSFFTEDAEQDGTQVVGVGS